MKDESHRAMDDITRAERAKDLLSNPLYVEAITVMKAAMFAEFEETKLSEEDKRHELWQRMQLMKLFEGRFESIIKQGKRAKQTLDMINEKEVNDNANNSQ